MKQGDQNKATRVLYDPEAQKGTLKSIGGSQSDDWNDILANQTVQSLCLKRSDPPTRYEQYSASTSTRTRMPSYWKAASKMAGTPSSAIRAAVRATASACSLFGDLGPAWEQKARRATDVQADSERRSRRRFLVMRRFMDEQPQAARTLQAGHVARLGEMSGHEGALSCRP